MVEQLKTLHITFLYVEKSYKIKLPFFSLFSLSLLDVYLRTQEKNSVLQLTYLWKTFYNIYFPFFLHSPFSYHFWTGDEYPVKVQH